MDHHVILPRFKHPHAYICVYSVQPQPSFMRKHKGPRSHPESDTPTGNKKKTRSAKRWELMQMGVTADPSQSGEHPSELVGKQRYMAWVRARNYVSLMFDTDGNGTRRMHCWLWTIFLHAPVKKRHHLPRRRPQWPPRGPTRSP